MNKNVKKIPALKSSISDFYSNFVALMFHLSMSFRAQAYQWHDLVFDIRKRKLTQPTSKIGPSLRSFPGKLFLNISQFSPRKKLINIYYEDFFLVRAKRKRSQCFNFPPVNFSRFNLICFPKQDEC